MNNLKEKKTIVNLKLLQTNNRICRKKKLIEDGKQQQENKEKSINATKRK